MTKKGNRSRKITVSESPVTRKTPATHRKIGDSLSRVAFVLALMGFIFQFGRVLLEYINWTSLTVAYPFPLDYGEGPILDQTLRMAHFENIYRNDFSSPPYTISNYTPLFIMVQVPFYWIFGPALWYGRLISILCVFLAAIFIFLTISTLTRDRIGSAVGGLLLIAFPYIRQWSVLNRVDELALALSWAALYVTVRCVGETDDRLLPKWGFWLATVLFVGSIYTRQTYALAAPVAAIGWLVFGTRGPWRSRTWLAMKLGFSVWGISLVLFLLINVLTRGGFSLHIVSANINPFFWEPVYRHLQEILRSFYPLLILTGLFLLLERWIKEERTRIWSLVAFYLFAACAGSVTIGKTGSSVNYLFELSAALSLAVGSALAWVGRLKWGGKFWLQTVVVAVLAFQLGIMVNWNGVDFGGYGDFLKNRVARQENVARLAQAVKDSSGIVLADEYMGLISLADRGLYFEPHGFKQLTDAGIVDETAFVKEIGECKFDLILLYNPSWWPAVLMRWTPAQLEMLKSSYRLDEVIDSVYVLRPGKK